MPSRCRTRPVTIAVTTRAGSGAIFTASAAYSAKTPKPDDRDETLEHHARPARRRKARQRRA